LNGKEQNVGFENIGRFAVRGCAPPLVPSAVQEHEAGTTRRHIELGNGVLVVGKRRHSCGSIAHGDGAVCRGRRRAFEQQDSGWIKLGPNASCYERGKVKRATKFVGILPLTTVFKFVPREGMYTTLLMSTGLTFGSISALYGLTNHIISQEQYTILVTAVIASAVVPTLIAQRWFQPTFRPIADEAEPASKEA
jgi:hypothetical protein